MYACAVIKFFVAVAVKSNCSVIKRCNFGSAAVISFNSYIIFSNDIVIAFACVYGNFCVVSIAYNNIVAAVAECNIFLACCAVIDNCNVIAFVIEGKVLVSAFE